jgi:gluconolactonase
MNWTTTILLLAMLQAPAAAPQPVKPLDGIPGVVAKGEMIQLVKEGFAFTEGPVPAADGGLYFTDVTSNRIHRLAPNGEISVLREQTNGANGLAVNRAGEVFAVEGSGKRVSKTVSGKVSVVTEGTTEKPLLAPNDIFLDAKGGVYFTDPGPRPVVAGRIVYVYYLPPDGKAPIMLDDKIGRPNGIILTTDGKTLIVNDTTSDTIFAYDVQSDGTVKNKRPFTKLKDVPADNSGADGMALDRENRLYVAASNGVQVFDKTGKHLGTIPVPRPPSNVAFSGSDKKTLFITAREGLYRLRMLSQGPDRPGK